MFTGLIETTGVLQEIRRAEKSIVLGIVPDSDDFEVAAGASVSVNGACLTLESKTGRVLLFTAVLETLDRTTFPKIRPGDRVNLERALRVSDRLDGHIVLGHVDAVGCIVADRRIGDSIVRGIRVPEQIRRFMAEKGSVAVDGISLTIARCLEEGIEISFIPRTLEKTTMALKRPGDDVNMECDVLARYIERLMSGTASGSETSGSLLEKLERSGF